MFSKSHIGVFALSVLSASEQVLSRPVWREDFVTKRADPVVVAVARDDTAAACATAVTVTVSGTATAISGAAVTISVGSAVATATSTASSSAIGDFGSCSIPQIEFGTGFDGRKETAFQPVDKASFNHDSADNIGVITSFICNTLTNTCGADETAKATCAKAQAAAAAETPLEGIDADAFNAVFGIQTNFKNVEAVSNTGIPIAGSTSNDTSSAAAATATVTTAATVVSTPHSPLPLRLRAILETSIEFGTGFDNRKETSFQPVDKTSFNHGSAQAISIITQFICDTLTNTCGADATAKATCAAAQTAANAAPPKEGIDADIFNGFFGITTHFADVPAVDNQGNVIAGSTGTVTIAASTAAAAPTTNAATKAATTTAAAATTATTAPSSTSGNLQVFTGNLGGVTAPEVVASGSQFQVIGNSLFNSKTDALARSCDVQHNQCANAANASGNKGDLTVNACGTQQTACNAANGA
ncbi:hypothetical protein B0H10DRAFT_1146913 [Mycena sp. CBHHK59/15]|nr:hypothetical protein B0H10DRAFT_1146913 [Mycena sp. CBHHK59/15]